MNCAGFGGLYNIVSKADKIFVYGTLLKKYPNAVDIIGDKKLRFLGNGKIQGELYDLGDYPGAIEKLGTYVHGEVYALVNSGIVLSKLDEYEEFDSKNQKIACLSEELQRS